MSRRGMGRGWPLEKRFMAAVTKTDTCWLWTGATNGRYGHIQVNGKTAVAPRVAYTLFRGPIPQGLFVLHSCDNPLCVNPEHLRTGTHRENMRDMVERGRARNPAFTQTHCSRGHALAGDNLRSNKLGRRVCRICANENSRRSYARHSAEIRARVPSWQVRRRDGSAVLVAVRRQG